MYMASGVGVLSHAVEERNKPGLLLNEISRFLEDRMRAIMQAMCNVLHTMDLFMAARITRLRWGLQHTQH
jgi:hypothetical protein